MNRNLPKNNACVTFPRFDALAFSVRVALLCLWAAATMLSFWYWFCRLGTQVWAREQIAEVLSPVLSLVSFLAIAVILLVACGLAFLVKSLVFDLVGVNADEVNIIVPFPPLWAILSFCLNGQLSFWIGGSLLMVVLGTFQFAKAEWRNRQNATSH